MSPEDPFPNPFRVALIVPTLNPGPNWIKWLNAFLTQTLRPELLQIVDSDSHDGSIEIALSYGFSIQKIDRDSFVHGGTRQRVINSLPECDIVVLMTQDAVFASPDSLLHLIEAFKDPSVGGAFGRQLPRKDASPIESHARNFNYPAKSRVKSLSETSELGIKTAFFSNSFGAFRRHALLEIGGFPFDLNFGEDVYASSKLLLNGWKIAYVAEATVFHSHRYTFLEEFRRYFRVGFFYGREQWIEQSFGKTGGEGLKFLLSEIAYIIPHHTQLLPSVLFRTILKLVGFHAGKSLAHRKPP